MPRWLIRKSKMSIERERRRQDTGTRSIGLLSDETRRRILQVLHENPGILSTEDLAEQLIADSDDATPADTERLQIRLHHVHLPKLAEYGLINWDKQEQAVSTPNRPVHEPAGFRELTKGSSEEAAPRPFTDDRLNAVLAIIEYGQRPPAREALARRLAQQEFEGQPTESRVKDISVELHHKHLPKLAEAGLIEYNVDDGTVEYLESVESTASLL